MGDPVDVSLNCTVRGAVPEVGDAVNKATSGVAVVVGIVVAVVVGATVVVVVVGIVVAVVVGATVVVVVVGIVVAVVVGATVVVVVVGIVVAVVVGATVVVVVVGIVVAVVVVLLSAATGIAIHPKKHSSINPIRATRMNFTELASCSYILLTAP